MYRLPCYKDELVDLLYFLRRLDVPESECLRVWGRYNVPQSEGEAVLARIAAGVPSVTARQCAEVQFYGLDDRTWKAEDFEKGSYGPPDAPDGLYYVGGAGADILGEPALAGQLLRRVQWQRLLESWDWPELTLTA